VTEGTNACGAERTAGILEAEGLKVIEAIPLYDDDSPNVWVWINRQERPVGQT